MPWIPVGECTPWNRRLFHGDNALSDGAAVGEQYNFNGVISSDSQLNDHNKVVIRRFAAVPKTTTTAAMCTTLVCRTH